MILKSCFIAFGISHGFHVINDLTFLCYRYDMKCTIIKIREHLRNYITFAIRHTIIISRAIEFDDRITADNILTEKLKSFSRKI